MQRTLLMIRHAKAGWASPLKGDFDRELNEKGKCEAPEIGKNIKEHHLFPDLIISSTAKRTEQTAKRIANEVDYDPEKIRWEEKLYHCIPSVIEEVIEEVNEDVRTLFIVAHNPGITEFVNELCPDFSVDTVPTCGVVGIHFEASEWGELLNAEKKVFLFEYPGKES